MTMKAQLIARMMGAAALAVAVSVSAQGVDKRTRGICCDKNHTPGWSLMTPEERKEHREKMLSLTNYEECRVFLAEHYSKMGERADQKGVRLRHPRYNPCDRMKARGRLN
jgi:hypothetical protein